MTYKTIGSSVYLFLLFEPCSIAFETLQVLKAITLVFFVLLGLFLLRSWSIKIQS